VRTLASKKTIFPGGLPKYFVATSQRAANSPKIPASGKNSRAINPVIGGTSNICRLTTPKSNTLKRPATLMHFSAFLTMCPNSPYPFISILLGLGIPLAMKDDDG
jgi:hypothetical protein